MTTFENKLLDQAISPYRQAGKFATNFARGKLAGDPVFREILQRGLVPADSHVVDIGCGQGLLSAWLLAAECMASTSQWPKDWASPPSGVSVHGIELMPADVLRANKAFGAHQDRLTFERGDMCATAFGKAQTVVILDVLHYVPFSAQEDVLLRVRDALMPSGMLILRIGDADGGLGFKVSNWVDHVVTLVRGHSLSRLYCRSLTDWVNLLTRLGFRVESKSMSHGTPFANVMLLAYLNK